MNTSKNSYDGKSKPVLVKIKNSIIINNVENVYGN